MSNQKFVNDLQIDQNIKDCIAVDLKKKRSDLDSKVFLSKASPKKEITLMSLEKNKERWLEFMVNIKFLHNKYYYNVMHKCKAEALKEIFPC